MDAKTSQIVCTDKDGIVTKTVTVKELTAREAMDADSMAGMSGNNAAFRAFLAVTEINGEPVVPAMNKSTIDALADRFSMREYDTLVREYSNSYILDKEALAQLEKLRGPLS